MNLEILGWKSSGIAGVDMDVNLSKNNKPTKISMIWLDSGGGKTTTHNLIKTCLSGDTSFITNDWDRVKRKDDDPFYKDEGFFELHTKFDSNLYKFKLTLNFNDETILFETEGGASGHINGYRPPSFAIPFLRKKFVELFILDGEMSEKMVEKGSDTAETTLETIYQLDNFKEIETNLDTYFDRLKTESAFSVSDKSKVTQINNRISAVKKRIGEIEDKIRKSNENKINASKEIIKFTKEKKEINTADQNLRDQLKEAEEDLIESDSNLLLYSDNLLTLLKMPFSISRNISDEYLSFKNNLEFMKIPEHSTKEFFRNLINEPKCVCDEPMTAEKKKIIIKNSENYIGSELTSFLNTMKDNVFEFIEDSDEDYQISFNNAEESLTNEIQNNVMLQRTIESKRKQIKNKQGRSLQDIENDISEQNSIISKENYFLTRTDEKTDEINEKTSLKNIDSIISLKNHISQLKNKLSVSEGLNKIDQKIEKISGLIKECQEKSKEALKKELIQNMNERLDQIISDDQIKVKDIQKSIIHSGASAGQSLALVYIFLSSAFELAGESNQFPLCVDSPAAPIGPQYRKRIAKMIVKLSNQYICLLQGGERYAWCKTLFDNSKDSITSLTLFKKTPYYQKYFDNPHKDLITFENSGMVNGYEFLRDFDSEDDDEQDIQRHKSEN